MTSEASELSERNLVILWCVPCSPWSSRDLFDKTPLTSGFLNGTPSTAESLPCRLCHLAHFACGLLSTPFLPPCLFLSPSHPLCPVPSLMPSLSPSLPSLPPYSLQQGSPSSFSLTRHRSLSLSPALSLFHDYLFLPSIPFSLPLPLEFLLVLRGQARVSFRHTTTHEVDVPCYKETPDNFTVSKYNLDGTPPDVSSMTRT